MLEIATATEAAGIEQLWLWEDCFKQGGIGPAAAILARTSGLQVGIGLLPVPLRNVALTAMEIATIARMFPGRLLPGIGHGVHDWMVQVDAAVASPMSLLREYADALRRLLHGERVTVAGRYVTLSDVALDWPPDQPPPVLVGAVGPRTLRLAGELGDGAILTGVDAAGVAEAMPALLDGRRSATTVNQQFDVVCFLNVSVDDSPETITAAVLAAGQAGATIVPLLVVGGAGKPPLGVTDRSLAAWIADVGRSVAALINAS